MCHGACLYAAPAGLIAASFKCRKRQQFLHIFCKGLIIWTLNVFDKIFSVFFNIYLSFKNSVKNVGANVRHLSCNVSYHLSTRIKIYLLFFIPRVLKL
jgi:hypothetical protein